MRILTLTNMYPPHHLGGYELSCWDVMRRFEARGHEVRVLTSDMRLPGVDDALVGFDGGGEVHRTLRFYWDDHELLSPPLWQRLAIERRNQRHLKRLLDRFRPDVVSVWNMGAMSLGLLTTLEKRGTPLVLAVCDDWLYYGPNLDAWMRLFVQRRRAAPFVSGATGVPTRLPRLEGAAFCFVSDFTRRTAFARAWPGICIDIHTVVYSGIDRSDFPPMTSTSHDWHGRLLYVGRIDERKGIETLIRALPELPEASLDIVGRGGPGYVESVRALATELGVAHRTNFTVSERSELRQSYAAADAVIFPSEWEEPFGLVPVEAMSCGTPVIATGTGGSAEFLRDGVNCLRFTPGDPSSLAAAVRALGDSPELRDRLVAGGAATADELDVDRLADVFEQWHVAAAGRFAAGYPPDRPPPGPASSELTTGR